MQSGHLAELHKLEDFLLKHDASRSMAAEYLGIRLSNICRYVAVLKKQEYIAIIRIDRCEITGVDVEFLTTNRARFPKSNQLELF